MMDCLSVDKREEVMPLGSGKNWEDGGAAS